MSSRRRYILLVRRVRRFRLRYMRGQALGTAFILPIFVAVLLSAFRSVENEKFVTVIVDGQAINFRTTELFVGKALEEAGISIGPDDLVLPPTLATMEGNEFVTVKRVERKRISREAPIPFGTSILPNDRLREKSEVELRAGIPGLAREIVDLETIDGVTTEKIVHSTVVVEPVARKIYQGRKKTAGTAGKSYWMEATAYTAGPESCGPYVDGKTAVMKEAGYGVAAVDPRIIPLGTRLYVPGYGFAVASDVGGAIKGNRIDLFISDLDTARAFGRSKVLVQLLD